VDTANESAADILLMADPRVAAVPVHDCGEELVDVRSCGTLSLSALVLRRPLLGDKNDGSRGDLRHMHAVAVPGAR